MRLVILSLNIVALVLAACAPAATPAPTVTPPPPAVSTSAPTEVMKKPTESPTEDHAMAATEIPTASPTEAPAALLTGAFVKQEVIGTGGFTLDAASGVLKLSDDFSVPSGPDLFVILSGATDVQLDYRQFSAQVLTTPKLNLAPLQNVQGGQAYQIPAGTDLSQFNTVIVWCESYSVAFIAALIER